MRLAGGRKNNGCYATIYPCCREVFGAGGKRSWGGFGLRHPSARGCHCDLHGWVADPPICDPDPRTAACGNLVRRPQHRPEFQLGPLVPALGARLPVPAGWLVEIAVVEEVKRARRSQIPQSSVSSVRLGAVALGAQRRAAVSRIRHGTGGPAKPHGGTAADSPFAATTVQALASQRAGCR